MRERILGPEIARAGVKALGPLAKQLIGLTQPPIDWASGCAVILNPRRGVDQDQRSAAFLSGP